MIDLKVNLIFMLLVRNESKKKEYSYSGITLREIIDL